MRGAVLVVVLFTACGGEDEEHTAGAGGGPPLCPNDPSCVSGGVPPEACPEGFVPDAGGCAPILPDAPCPPGLMTVPGSTQCRPLGACGDNPWGLVELEPATVFVDARYVGTETGSSDQPYRSIQTAIDSAPRGGQVVIAAGTYSEYVVVSKPLRLHGRCAELVALVGGTDPTRAALEISSPGVTVVDVSVSGDTFGIALAGGDAIVDRVHVHDTPHLGVGAFDSLGVASLTLRNSLLENNGESAVYVTGASFIIEGSEIRDPKTFLADQLALAVSVLKGVNTGVTAQLRVTGSFIHGGRGAGVVVSSATALLEATAVHDTRPLDATLEDGMAVIAQTEPDSPRAGIELRGVSIRRCHEAGLVALDADALVDTTTIRDVMPEATGGPALGMAIQQTTGGYQASLSRTLVADIEGFGVFIAGAQANIEGMLVRGSAHPSEGDGILALTLGTRARATIAHTRVERWTRAGISNFGADIVLGSSVLECNTIQLDGEQHSGSFNFEDAGGNLCGCNGEMTQCKVVSSNLQPPQSL